jgi:hypothetical protein
VTVVGLRRERDRAGATEGRREPRKHR